MSLAAVALLAVGTPSIALHYGETPPLPALSVYDWVVLEASTSSPAAVRPARPIAYVAASQLHPSAPWADEAPTGAVLGEQADWGSRVMDPADPRWRAHLLERVLPGLWARGFRGFFFDAMDGFRGLVDDEGPRWRGTAELLRAARARFPSAVIIVNRGFEILDELEGVVDAVAAESLFRGYDVASGAYPPVGAEDRAWLADRLGEARAAGFETLVIDYAPPYQRREARAIAGRIAELGHVPWVGTGRLDTLGVGALEVIPRDVVLLFDSDAQPHPALSASVRLLALPLEYLGLVPRLVDVRGSLPERSLVGEVAGVVGWLGERPLTHPLELRRFLARQIEHGVPIALFGNLPAAVDPTLLGRMGLRRGRPVTVNRLEVAVSDPSLGFEAPVRPVAYELVPLWAESEGSRPLLELRAREARFQPLLIASWGGLALQPFAMEGTAGGEGRWVINPFTFLAEALQLEPAPIVDPTTENGRRLLVTHIDGDGAGSRSELPGNPPAITVIRRWIERHPFPHTVSVVEGELVEANGEAKRHLQSEARRLLRLPHVEPASHGFAHPFVWSRFEDGEGRHLDVPGGRPDLRRELLGSIEFVRALSGKPVRLYQWTGDGLPGPDSLRVLEQAGYLNLNGGLTVATRERPSVIHVSPRGIPVLGEGGDRWGEVGFQTFAPVENENVFTNGWTGPYWGYRRARETFEITGAPRRLAPIGIYYHLFSGTKQASMRALAQVYRDALERRPLPVHASTWVEKAKATRRAVVARTLDGSHVVRGMGEVRTVRLPEGLRALDPAGCEGVVGDRETDVGRFVHLDGGDRARLAYTGSPVERGPWLIEASARLRAVERGRGKIRLRFEGPPPVVVRVRDCGRKGERRFRLRRGLTLECSTPTDGGTP